MDHTLQTEIYKGVLETWRFEINFSVTATLLLLRLVRLIVNAMYARQMAFYNAIHDNPTYR